MDNSLHQDNGQQFALEGRGDVSCLLSLHPSVPGMLQMGWPSSFILSWSQASRRRPFRYLLEGNCFKMSCWFLPSVQSLSRVRLFVTPRTVAHQTSLSITNSGSSLKLMSVKLVMLSPPLVFSLSQHQGLFKWVSSSHQVAKVLEL